VSGEQKNAEGQEHGFSAQVSYTIYVSSSGHPFVRWRTTAGKFSRSGETHGSDRGGERAAVMLTLIRTARLNDVDPQTWLADVLARINDHAALRLHELLPWNWRKPMPSRAEAASAKRRYEINRLLCGGKIGGDRRLPAPDR